MKYTFDLGIFVMTIFQKGEFIPSFVPKSKRALFWERTANLKEKERILDVFLTIC